VYGWRDSIKQTFNKPTERTSKSARKQSGCTFPCLHHGNPHSLFGPSFYFFLPSLIYPADLIRRHLCAINAECVSYMLIHIYVLWVYIIYESRKESPKKKGGGVDSRLTCFIQSGCWRNIIHASSISTSGWSQSIPEEICPTPLLYTYRAISML